MNYGTRLPKGKIFIVFRNAEKIRFILDNCYVFFQNQKCIGKGTFIGVVQDFQIDEIKDPSPRLLECFGDHITFAINTAQPHRYRAIEFFSKRPRYTKTGFPFFWDDRPYCEDDGFRPAHALMFSFGVSPRNKMTFLISTVTKCGIDDDKELWKEDDIIYEMEGTDDYGAERMKCFKENRMTLSHFIMDYVNKNIDKLEVQY